jgi:hypothetical protein
MACLLPLPHWAVGGLLALAPALLLGLLTRWAAVVGVAGELMLLLAFGGRPGVAAALTAMDLAALAMIGPGAYSIDAALFGRRVITLDPDERADGGKGSRDAGP